MIILQNACGPAVAELDITRAHHAAYCQRHGYEYRDTALDAPAGRRKVWSKIEAICNALKVLDDQVLVWLDADAVIVKDVPLDHVLPKDQSLGMVRASAEHLSWWNTGVMFIRRNELMRRTFADVAEFGPLQRGGVGSPRGGDQATINYFLDDDFPYSLSSQYNSYQYARAVNPVIVAFHGEDAETRKAKMKALLEG